MSDQDTKIRHDALNFANNVGKLSYNSQVNELIAMLREHADLSKKDIVLDYSDLQTIVDEAKKLWIGSSAPIDLAKNSNEPGHRTATLDFNEYNQLCLIKATISVLNHKECFKKIPRFDEK